MLATDFWFVFAEVVLGILLLAILVIAIIWSSY